MLYPLMEVISKRYCNGLTFFTGDKNFHVNQSTSFYHDEYNLTRATRHEYSLSDLTCHPIRKFGHSSIPRTSPIPLVKGVLPAVFLKIRIHDQDLAISIV